jgi:hypothetical protein
MLFLTRLGNGWLGNGQLRLGDKALDGSAMLQWMDGSRWTTARDRQLGDKALDGSATDSLAMDSLAIKRWTAWR